MNIKEFIGCEISRNKNNAALYTAVMHKALGTEIILIGHHLCFELGNDINTENEIPSADTLMFDHDIMSSVFGDKAVSIMQHLAATPTDSRDAVLQAYWDMVNGVVVNYVASGFEASQHV